MENKTFFYFLLFILILFACKKSENQIQNADAKKPFENIVLFVETTYGTDTSYAAKQIIDRLKIDSINTFILDDVKRKIHFLLPKIKARTCSSTMLTNLSENQILITDIEHLEPKYSTARIDSIDFFDNPEKYPFQFLISEGRETRKQITLFNLTGVTAIARGVYNAIEKIGIDSLINNIKPYFDEADIVHISNEVSIAENCQCVAKTLRFCSKREHFEILNKLHCNVVELTGNHNRDYGDKAFMETLNWYKKNKIKTFGGGANPENANTPLVLILKDSSRLGLIGFNEFCPLSECADNPGECGANRYDSAKAKVVLAKMKNDLHCSYIIASVQFGESDTYYPTGTQKKICKFLSKNGADLVYGSQAHQVQEIEFIDNKPVFYGLGNFIFDQLHKTGLRQGYFLQLYFFKGKLIQARPVFTWMGNDLRLKVLKGMQANEIKKEILKYQNN